jgi:hypothetical protein
MWYWPLSNKVKIPSAGEPGSFWEDRKDRRHCGVDLYAKEWSEVAAAEEGRILSTTIFTTPNLVSYWNLTYSVLVETKTGLQRYCELGSVAASPGTSVAAGDVLGCVGAVVDRDKVTHTSPAYIRDLIHKNNITMLHFELWKNEPVPVSSHASTYRGGNWFGKKKPENLLDPTEKLREALDAAHQSI